MAYTKKPHIYCTSKAETVYHRNDGRDPRCAGCGDSVSTELCTRYYCSRCNRVLENSQYKFCPQCGVEFTGRFENKTYNEKMAEARKTESLHRKEIEAKERAEYEKLKKKYENQ